MHTRPWPPNARKNNVHVWLCVNVQPCHCVSMLCLQYIYISNRERRRRQVKNHNKPRDKTHQGLVMNCVAYPHVHTCCWFGLVWFDVVTRRPHGMLPRRTCRRMQATPFEGFRAASKFPNFRNNTAPSSCAGGRLTLGQRHRRWVLPMPNEGLRASGQAWICAKCAFPAHAGARTSVGTQPARPRSSTVPSASRGGGGAPRAHQPEGWSHAACGNKRASGGPMGVAG